ncbi:MAG TPA: hypothetical protein VGB66_19215 [Longimicrobium sp.]|jgi:hypothetical protein
MSSTTGDGRQLARRYLVRLLGWTAAGGLLFVPIVLMGDDPDRLAGPWSGLPRFLALVIPLAALPAGFAAGPMVWTPGGAVRTRAGPRFLALALGTALLALLLSGWIGPWASQAPAALLEPRQLDLLDLLRADGRGIAESNRLGWELHHRLALSALAAVAAVLGLLGEFWTRETPLPALRHTVQWLLVLVLLASAYGGIERSHEIAVHAPRVLRRPAWAEILGFPAGMAAGLLLATVGTLMRGTDGRTARK